MKTFNFAIALSATLAICATLNGAQVLFAICKPLTTLLVIASLLRNAGQQTWFERLLLCGLVAGLGGDLLLLDEAWFVFGLSFFVIAHCCFIAAFVNRNGVSWNWLAFLVLVAVALGYYLYLLPTLSTLALPVAFYTVVIVTMAWQGLGLYIARPSGPHLAIAAAVILFMFSDSMIAWNKFVQPFSSAPAVILVSYWVSITLLANATVKISAARSSTT